MRHGGYEAVQRGVRGVARLGPGLFPRAAARVRANLKLAFGAADPALVRAVFRHFGAATADLLWFPRLFDPGRFEEHFRFEGGALEHYHAERPGGAVFVTGHFGNWELFGATFRHVGIPLSPVARPVPGPLGRRLDRFRRASGQEVIPKDQALPLAMKAIRAGRCVAFLMDQAAGKHGIPVPFFGRPAWTFTAPAALALKLGVPLYAGYSTRLGDGIRYRCFAETVPVEGDVESLTARLNAILEGYVRARPEQWWWFHRRFKPPRSLRRGLPVDAAGLAVGGPPA